MKILDQHLAINSKNFRTIIDHLVSFGGKARIVGGAVRDGLLDVPSSDIDIATDLPAEQVTEALKAHNIRVIPTGIKFGTVTALIRGETFEITTLRRDISCDGRRAKVKYTKDFAEDAARRDFTINALSYCPSEEKIYDYFDGIKDLKAGRVVFIGEPEQRIGEDYLRILRFFRFSCRYAKEIDQEGLSACVRHKDMISILSGERIKSEIDSLLQLDGAPEIVHAMYESGILQQAFPVKTYNHQMHVKALEVAKSFGVSLDVLVIYAILFMDCAFSLNQIVKLKFSKAEAKLVVSMIDLQNDSTMMEDSLRKIWLEDRGFIQHSIFASVIKHENESDLESINKLYERLQLLERPLFPLRGRDITPLGYSGKELGNAINLLKTKWIQSEFTASRDELINLVREK
ncbi:MAG: poly(A) polymerase [Rickettsiales bacterium]|nr:MAG: poly(A) polymerase [Rickettsiales bacterium]